MESKFKLLCPICKLPQNHVVRTEIEDIQSIGAGDDDKFIKSCDQIVQCMGCDCVSYRQYAFREDEYDTQYDLKLFPERNIYDLMPKTFEGNVPKNIIRIYNEVITTYNNGVSTLCSAGIRAIIEGVCKIKGVTGGNVIKRKKDGTPRKKDENDQPIPEWSYNLDGKIQGLFEGKFIREGHVDALDQLRFLGNAAIHELDKPSPDELIAW